MTRLHNPGKSMDVGYSLNDPTPPPPPPPPKSYSAMAARTTHFLVRVQPLDR